MILILVRHGQASADSGAAAALTPRGREQALRTARALKKRLLFPAAVWHSPKKRARETAEAVAGILGVPPDRILERKSLGPDEKAGGILEELEKAALPSLLLVSHLPTLQDLACRLLETDASPFHFPPAGYAVLKREEGRPWEAAGVSS